MANLRLYGRKTEMRVGILGTGFGKVHAGIYTRLPNVEIAGVFGRTPEKLQEMRDEFKVHVTTEIDDLITDPTIDMIDVCLPTALHKEYVVKALQHQKHVFCETPVSYTIEDAEEMKRAAEQYHKRVFVDLFLKFSDPHKYAFDTIKTADLGKPLVVTAYQRTPPHWGNMNLNQLVQDFMLHNFDFVTELLGRPQEVTANGVATENSHVVATLNYSEGLAVVESSTLLPWKFPFGLGFTVVCESGTITFEGQFGEETVQRLMLYTNDTEEAIALSAHDEYEEAIKHVLACITTETPRSPLSLEAAIESLRIVVATKQSLQDSRPVKLEA
jgi:predicted dehydrogenase